MSSPCTKLYRAVLCFCVVVSFGFSSSSVFAQSADISLLLGEMESGEYGWRWAGGTNKDVVTAEFQQTADDLELSVVGYDIDNNTEVSVSLNGDLLGYLPKGTNNALASLQAFEISAEDQISGTNQVVFAVKRSGWRWGVTDITIDVLGPKQADFTLAVGETESGQYGWRWAGNTNKELVTAEFQQTDEDLELSVVGYDVDNATEVSVSLNGDFLGYLPKGANNALTSLQAFEISAEDQIAGANQLVFAVRKSGWRWGVTDITLEALITNLSPTAVTDSVALQQGEVVRVDVLDNDTDDSPLTDSTISVQDSPAHGTTEVVDGEIEYSHGGANGTEFPTDSFTYTVTDSLGLESNTATVTISVEVPQAPVLSKYATSALYCAAYPESSINRPRVNTLVISPNDLWEEQIETAASGTEVLLEDGVYILDKPQFDGNTVYMANADVTVRALSGNPDAVIIRGSGYPAAQANVGFMIAADGITIADLTVHNMRDHAISIQPGLAGGDLQGTHVYNVHLYDVGTQHIKGNMGGISSDTVVACSAIGYSPSGVAGDYIGGVDIHSGADTLIRDNYFYNITGDNSGCNVADPSGSCPYISAPAIYMNASSDTIIERNIVVDSFRGISLGLVDGHTGGIVRNNFVYRSEAGDMGISIDGATNAIVEHNTVIVEGYQGPIEVRGGYGHELRNNLTNEPIWLRDGASVIFVDGNIESANADDFNALGDLHLSAESSAIAAGVVPVAVTADIDGDPRSGPWDVGADQIIRSVQAPVANTDTASVSENGAVAIDVLANDTGDIDASTVTTNVTPAPTKGYLSADEETGFVTYTPYTGNAGFTDTFGYLVKSAAGVQSNIATVTVTIEATAVLLMANGDTATVGENASVAIDVLANDTGNLDASTVTTNVTPSPTKGYLSTDELTGVITYTPYVGNPRFVDTFGYLVKNAAGVASNVALVTVTIEPEAIILMANADAADVGDGTSVAIDVLANDTGGIDPTTVRTNVSPSPAKGYLRTDADTGVITYTSYVGNVGYTDTFGYQVKDDAGVLSNIALVSVTIVGDAEEPQTVLAVNDTVSLVAQTGLLIDVLANDLGATSTAVIESLQITVVPSQGAAEIQQGQVLYTHSGTDALADSFTYAITDDQGVVSAASVAITIEPQVNEAPIAVDDQQALTAYDEIQINVLANDYDIAGFLDVTSVAIVEQPSSGSVSVDEGVVTYTHDGSLSESDYFSYIVADSEGAQSNIAIVDLNIDPFPDTAPVVVDDSFSLVTDTARTIDVLANDTDKNHNIDSSTLVIVQSPSAGTAQIVDGAVVYDHDGGALETDFFTYKVSDLTSLESETVATVSITLEPVMPPQVVDDSITLAQGESVMIDVLANDTANTLINPASIFITLDPQHSSEFDVQEDGLIVYTHNGDGSLIDTIKYKIENEQGMQSLTEGEVTIKIASSLITINDLSYEGAFKFPGNTYGDSTASYAQGVIEVNGGSIFIAGHSQHDAIAEYLVPTLVKDSFELSSLNEAANPVQDFSSVIDRAATGNPESLDQITGLELVDGQLFVNLMEFYDGPGDNTLTTMVISDAGNLATSQVSALHSMDGAARAAGWLSPVPESWKAELGTDFISGHSSGDPIISRLSVGPSAFAIDLPASLESTESTIISTTELQGFSLSSPLHTDLYNTTRSNAVWTHLSRARYGFIVPGTGTYMTVGWSGGHESGVGYKLSRADGSECPGFCAEDESDMYNYFWLWKVEDWLRVKAGEILPHEITPYESGELDLPFQTNGELNEIGGASYDPLTGLLYISILRANESGYDLTPVVVAYQVTTPSYVE